MKRRVIISAIGLLAVAGTFTCGGALAQSYPNKPIYLVVPFPAGSSTDVIARNVGNKLAEKLKQPVIIENKTGAGGNIATQAVATSAPDGYTLLMGTVANAVSATFYPKLGYDFVKDFAPITLTTTAPLVVIAQPNLPANNLKEVLEYAKKKSGGLTFGSGGNGTANHLIGEMIRTKSGVKLTHVPYKGGIAATADLMGGSIDLVIGSLVESMSSIQTGKVKAIAVTSLKRASLLPNVPAISETLPGFDAVGWHGLLAPAGTPKEIVALLNREVNMILRMPDVQAKLQTAGALPAGTTPEEFGQFIRKEIAKWGEAVKKSGARPE